MSDLPNDFFNAKQHLSESNKKADLHVICSGESYTPPPKILSATHAAKNQTEMREAYRQTLHCDKRKNSINTLKRKFIRAKICTRRRINAMSKHKLLTNKNTKNWRLISDSQKQRNGHYLPIELAYSYGQNCLKSFATKKQRDKFKNSVNSLIEEAIKKQPNIGTRFEKKEDGRKSYIENTITTKSKRSAHANVLTQPLYNNETNDIIYKTRNKENLSPLELVRYTNILQLDKLLKEKSKLSDVISKLKKDDPNREKEIEKKKEIERLYSKLQPFIEKKWKSIKDLIGEQAAINKNILKVMPGNSTVEQGVNTITQLLSMISVKNSNTTTTSPTMYNHGDGQLSHIPQSIKPELIQSINIQDILKSKTLKNKAIKSLIEKVKRNKTQKAKAAVIKNISTLKARKAKDIVMKNLIDTPKIEEQKKIIINEIKSNIENIKKIYKQIDSLINRNDVQNIKNNTMKQSIIEEINKFKNQFKDRMNYVEFVEMGNKKYKKYKIGNINVFKMESGAIKNTNNLLEKALSNFNTKINEIKKLEEETRRKTEKKAEEERQKAQKKAEEERQKAQKKAEEERKKAEAEWNIARNLAGKKASEENKSQKKAEEEARKKAQKKAEEEARKKAEDEVIEAFRKKTEEEEARKKAERRKEIEQRVAMYRQQQSTRASSPKSTTASLPKSTTASLPKSTRASSPKSTTASLPK